ncbi:MAG: redoxin domain-containing protein [Alphaproteobacteria bacterium]|nr:redoxin domain-containing protein [Alphaproteobacteria bacterium]
MISILLLGISFVAGVLTLFASCVLPILPVIVGGSLSADGNKEEKFVKRLTIVGSLGISVIVFTLVLKFSTAFIGVPQEVWSYISGGILIFFGVATLFPRVWTTIIASLQAKSQKVLTSAYTSKSKLREVFLGGALGPVFATCSPVYFFILANVLPVNFSVGFIYLLVYACGLSLALYVVALMGDKLISSVAPFVTPEHPIMKGIGVLILFVGIAIITGIDKKIEIYLTEKGYNTAIIEQKILALIEDTDDMQDIQEKKEVCDIKTLTTKNDSALLDCKVKAINFVFPDGYINTNGEKISLDQYKGKVILFEFWTYSCINCQRVIPYLNSWYEKYKDDGLVVIGVHTPEFSFEKDYNNVLEAVKKMNITWPVVLDNDFKTWRAYKNNFWPHKYLIDRDGYIVYHHIGEGKYEETEKLIQKLLAVEESITHIESNEGEHTGEIYFGYERNTFVLNSVGVRGEKYFSPISDKKFIELSGMWNVQKEYVEAISDDASIQLPWHGTEARCIFSSPTKKSISVKNNDEIIKKIEINSHTLYTVAQYKKRNDYYTEIKVPQGMKVYTCVFG